MKERRVKQTDSEAEERILAVWQPSGKNRNLLYITEGNVHALQSKKTKKR